MTNLTLTDGGLAAPAEQSPLFRAVRKAVQLRREYGCSQGELEMLLGRWRWLRGVKIREHEIKTAAFAATLEVKLTPLTKREAEGILGAALEAFEGDADMGARALRSWCAERGAVSPTQADNLVSEYRRRVQEGRTSPADAVA